MMDAFLTTGKYRSDVKVYYANTGVNLQGFQKWNKPRGASMVYMNTVAGGGGGGGGFSGTSAGGGGGGACSGSVRFLCPAVFLPDTMYVQVGAGGKGGAADAAGTAGLNSYILTSPTAVLPNIVCYSGVNAPGGGAAGTGAAGGTGGSVPTVAVIQPINNLGIWFGIVGIVGAAGGAPNANGTSVSAWGTRVHSAGAGGGGVTSTDRNGGDQNVSAILDMANQGYYPSVTGSVAIGGRSGAINGGGGVNRLLPFFNSGGSGGATLDAGTGGIGGKGGYGCGGGGGGGSTTGGAGGDGGDGLVVIISW